MIHIGYKMFSLNEPSPPFSRAGSLVFAGISTPTILFVGIYFAGVSSVCPVIFIPS